MYIQIKSHNDLALTVSFSISVYNTFIVWYFVMTHPHQNPSLNFNLYYCLCLFIAAVLFAFPYRLCSLSPEPKLKCLCLDKWPEHWEVWNQQNLPHAVEELRCDKENHKWNDDLWKAFIRLIRYQLWSLIGRPSIDQIFFLCMCCGLFAQSGTTRNIMKHFLLLLN